MNLKDKVVVITGGSKGLGKALAILFVQEGSRVIISSRSKKELEEVANDIGAEFFVADVAKEKEVFELENFATKKYGRIDVWINNAGTWIGHSTIEDINFDKMHNMMEINLFGTIYGSQAAMKIMKKQKEGIIVNVLSTSSLVGRALSAGYAASKWAARGFNESLRLALEDENILVIGVHPDGFKSEIFGEHQPSGYQDFMEPSFVAEGIVNNLKKTKPDIELIIEK